MTIYEHLRQIRERANELSTCFSSTMVHEVCDDNHRLLEAMEKLLVAIEFYGAVTEENIQTGETARKALAQAKDILAGYDPRHIPGN